MKRWKTAVSTALMLGVSLWFFSIAVAGLQSGAVQDFSKHSSVAAVFRATHPVHFWIVTLLWLLIGCMSLGAGVSSALSLWRKTPLAQARKKAALDRAATAQVRQVEAGQVPEPLWVRFPGPTETIPEPELTTYIEDVFMPFWAPLSPEALAAYLRRNPPPSGEWQELMADLLDLDVQPD